jgi:hypothetical protein
MLIKACVIPLLYLDFEIRRDYIVANLCENRNRPMLNCNGKCYLAKKIAEAKKQEEKRAESDFLSKLFAPATDLSSISALDFKKAEDVSFRLKSVKFKYNTSLKSPGCPREIFHPPLA